MYIGDFTTGKTVIKRFNTRKADGTPITLSGGTISVYKNSTTESTSGVTLTTDYDSRTGLQHVAVDTSSDGTFYASGNDFDIILTAGTVDSVSVVGVVIGTFSIQNRSALRPTTADRTLDVSAGGEAGLDWANIGSPTTSVSLSGTAVNSATTVGSVSGSVGSVSAGVSIGVNGIAATSFTNNSIAAAAIATGAITSTKFASGAINAAAIASSAITSAKFATDAIDANAIADNAINAGAIATGAITNTKFAAGAIDATVIADGAIDTATFATGTTIPRCTLVDTITTYTGNTPQTGDSYDRIGDAGQNLTGVGPICTSALLNSGSSGYFPGSLGHYFFVDYVNDFAAIQAKTDLIPGSPAATGDAMTLTSGERTTLSNTILSSGDIDGFTFEETLKLCLSALASLLSGATGGASTIRIRAADNSKDRIVATVDANGNRTSVTLDAAG